MNEKKLYVSNGGSLEKGIMNDCPNCMYPNKKIEKMPDDCPNCLYPNKKIEKVPDYCPQCHYQKSDEKNDGDCPSCFYSPTSKK